MQTNTLEKGIAIEIKSNDGVSFGLYVTTVEKSSQ